MGIKIDIDVAKIAADFKELAYEVEQDLQKSVSSLAAMTHAKVAEMASQELKSPLKQLQDNLGFEEIMPGVWVVSIDQGGLWIEEGIKQDFDMKPGLLKNATHVSKDGHKYKVIPFDHGKPPTQMTPYAQSLVQQIKSKLKQDKIPFKKIEKDSNGSPRVGLLHQMNIESERPTARASHPALSGLSIYQSKGKDGNVRRDILTFRTVSDGPGSQDKWIHPGYSAKHFLDRAAEWALNEWEQKILPEILDAYR